MRPLLIIAALMLATHSATASVYSLPRSVIGCGGHAGGATSHAIRGTAGQAAIGLTAGTIVHRAGFWYVTPSAVVATDESDHVPMVYTLGQNHPNPFNPITTIEFTLPDAASVDLEMFDVLGRRVATLVRERLDPGRHAVVVDAHGLTSGMYFYRLRANDFTRIRKMLLVK
jgi:hypothetical protein